MLQQSFEGLLTSEVENLHNYGPGVKIIKSEEGGGDKMQIICKVSIAVFDNLGMHA